MKKIIFSMVIAILSLAQSGYASTNLSIQGKDYKVDTLRNVKIGPGTMYTALLYQATDGTKKFRGFFVTTDMKNNDRLQYKMEIGNDTTLTTELISSIAKRKTAPNNYYIAGINADFFITTSYVAAYAGTPHMDCIMEGEVASSGFLPAENYGHFFMDYAENMWCAHPEQNYSITLPDNNTVALPRINLDVYENELVLFNSKYGVNTHTTNATEVTLVLAPGEKWKVNGDVKLQVVGNVETKGKMAIPMNGAVLSAKGTAASYVNSLKAGDIVTAHFNFKLKEYGISPDIKMCSGGDVILLYHNDVTMDAFRFINERDSNNPRTMVGYSQDGSTMVWGLIDGRSTNSAGCTYPEGADVMRYAGCYDALNLDGGGSAEMYIRNLDIVNSPSDGKERAVSNGMYAVLNAPEDNEIAEIRFIDYAMKFPKYGIYSPEFYGYNQYGMLIDTDVEGVVLSCDAALGSVRNGDTFIGDGTGTHALTATYKGITTSIPVTIVDGENLSLRLENVMLDGFKDYKVEVQAVMNETPMPIDANALVWNSEDAAVARIESNSGILRGVDNGTTKIHGAVGDFTGTLNVTVEKPTAHEMAIDSNLDPTTWSKSQSGGKNLAIAPLENGMELTYTGAAGRAPNIKLTKKMNLWSLPDSIRIRINPGEAPIKSIVISTKTPQGGTVNTTIERDFVANVENVLLFNLSEILDGLDYINYPIGFNSMTINMGTSTAGKEYSIKMSGFETIYDAIPAGVETVNSSNSQLSIYPNPVAEGDNVNIAVEGAAKVMVVDMQGREFINTKVEGTNGSATISTTGLAKGIYNITVDNGKEIKSNTLIIK